LAEATKLALLLLAHGTPDTIDEIPQYLSNVTGGRPMPQSVIEEIQHRYSLIGHSPLTEITLAQGRQLAEHTGLPVYVGMRNWKPYIADVVRQMRADGVTGVVAICLAPQNSRTSVGLYRRAVLAETTESIAVDFIEGWADHPRLADAFAERLRPIIVQATDGSGERVVVLFTAHSVPCRTIQVQPPTEGQSPQSAEPDPYAIEAKHTAALVAERVGLSPDQWYFAFQSQGMSGGPWIGPTVEDTLTALHGQGVKSVIVQPIGFLCDHVEILYDVDIAFREHAVKLGMKFDRPESLNESALLTAALADLAQQGLARLNAKLASTAAR
jgi:protoporphyrin/coproporphyrin ferrochelatase